MYNLIFYSGSGQPTQCVNMYLWTAHFKHHTAPCGMRDVDLTFIVSGNFCLFSSSNIHSIWATLSVLSHDVYVIIFRRINEVIYAAMSRNWQCVSTSVWFRSRADSASLSIDLNERPRYFLMSGSLSFLCV